VKGLIICIWLLKESSSMNAHKNDVVAWVRRMAPSMQKNCPTNSKDSVLEDLTEPGVNPTNKNREQL